MNLLVPKVYRRGRSSRQRIQHNTYETNETRERKNILKKIVDVKRNLTGRPINVIEQSHKSMNNLQIRGQLFETNDVVS